MTAGNVQLKRQERPVIYASWQGPFKHEGEGPHKPGQQKKGQPMNEQHLIYGIHITNRAKSVPVVQKVFTDFGCSIRTRLGLHDVHDNHCSPSGMIILDMVGPTGEIKKFEKALKAISGVDVKKMAFKH
jgi:hypothetical protein